MARDSLCLTLRPDVRVEQVSDGVRRAYVVQ
jgi:hypothetical protein